MNEKLRELYAKRAALVKDSRKIIDAADAESRPMTAEERSKWEAINSDIDALQINIKDEERQAGLDALTRGQSGRISGDVVPEDGRGGEQRTGRNSEEYRKAFEQYLRRGYNSLSPEELRAMTVGSDANGGFTVFDEHENQIVDFLSENNVLRRIGRVITTGNDRLIPVKAGKGTAYWTGESADYTPTNPTFTQKSLNAYKLTYLNSASEELVHDSAFNVLDFIAKDFADTMGETEEAAFLVGDGASKPTGLTTQAAVGKTAAAAAVITSDEIIEFFHSLKSKYRKRGTFLMSDDFALAIRKLKDSSGRYIWQPSLSLGAPDTLLARPVEFSAGMPSIGASAVPCLFGDFSYFWIGDRGGRVFQTLIEKYAEKGEVGYRGYERVDAVLTLAESMKAFKMAA